MLEKVKAMYQLMNRAVWVLALFWLGQSVFVPSVSPMIIDQAAVVDRYNEQAGRYNARNTQISLLQLRHQFLEKNSLSQDQGEIKKIVEIDERVTKIQEEIDSKLSEVSTIISSNINQSVKLLDECEKGGNEAQAAISTCNESVEKGKELNKELMERLKKCNDAYDLYPGHKALLKVLGNECVTISSIKIKEIDKLIGQAFDNCPLTANPDDLTKEMRVVTDLIAFTKILESIDLLQKNMRNTLDACYKPEENPETVQQTMVDTLARLKYKFDQQHSIKSEISSGNIESQKNLLGKYSPFKISWFEASFNKKNFPNNKAELENFRQRVVTAKEDFVKIENLQNEAEATLNKKQLQQKLTMLQKSLTNLKERLDVLKNGLSTLKIKLAETKKSSIMGTEPTDPAYLAAKEQIKNRAGAFDANGFIFSLENHNLTAIPPEIGDLNIVDGKPLTVLWLNRNKLKMLPAEIGKLTSLNDSLYLRGNQLETLPPEIGNLINVKELYLNDNKLTTLPATIGNLARLQALHLENNNLERLPPEIGKLSGLRSLNLGNNKLKALPSEIGNLTGMWYLVIDKNVVIPQKLLDREGKGLKIERK